MRVASRMANTLRGGTAVATYEEFETCVLILISVPDELAFGVIEELGSAQLTYAGKAVVICSARLGAENLELLREQGAETGSLTSPPGFEGAWFVIEGDRLVERLVRPLVAARGTRITTIGRGLKGHYVNAMMRLESEFPAFLKEVADLLKEAGIPAMESAVILEREFKRMVRSYLRSGKIG